MPLTIEADLLRQVQRHVDGRDERLGIAEVRSLVEVDSCQRKIMFLAEFRSFQKLFARHAKLAVMLARLGMGVMGVDGDARDETKPDGVREWAKW